MMKEKTAKKIEMVRKKVNNESFTEADIKEIISIPTLKKYNLIEVVDTEIIRKEITIDELIKKVNSVIKNNSYCDGYYEKINNKIFYTRRIWKYKFKK